MKKLFASILALSLCMAALLGVTACESTPEDDKQTFTVATNCPFGMYEYLGDDGKIYGIDIEIAGLFAEEYNYNLVIKNIDFDAIFTQVQQGYADAGMAGITVSEERKATYDFTNTYCKASQKLIVLESNTDFDGATDVASIEAVLAELVGKKIGYQTGTTGGMYVNGDKDFGYTGFANITGQGYDTAVTAVNDMKNGNVYAVIVDEGPAQAIVNATEDVQLVDVKLTDEEYAFVLKKGNTELQTKFNDFLAKIKEDGTYDKIEAKYYQDKGTKVGYTVSID